MKPSTVRVVVYGLIGLFATGLLITLAKGEVRSARDVALAIVGLALIGSLAAGAWWIRTKPRREAARDAAASLGLRFSPADTTRLIDRPFALFRRAATVRGLENVMTGDWQGSAVTVCEYWYARSSNPSLDDVERFTCVMMPLPPWWPELELTRETVGTRSVGYLTRREVNLESEAFNRRYSVRSADPRFRPWPLLHHHRLC